MTISDDDESTPGAARIAVAIPCFNEAAAIAAVVAQFLRGLAFGQDRRVRQQLDRRHGAIARGLGVRVVDVPEQGKGHAVRSAFATLSDFDAIVLTDGDGTYPAEAAPLLIGPVLDGSADMTVGARQPTPGAGAMTLTRGIGNRLIRAAFRILIGPGTTDLLSGYRAFGRRYREEVRLASSGFEIETELASEAVARRLRVVEISIPYHPRIAGTQSKLRAFRDGRRILATIVMQSLRLRPYRPLLLGLVPCAVLAMTVHRAFAFVGMFVGLAVLMIMPIDQLTRRIALEKQEILKR